MPSSFDVVHGHVIWFFGPPGAGKTTVSLAAHKRLEEAGIPVVLFDGDIVREIVGEGIGRSEEDRILLTKRYAKLTNLLSKSRVIVLLAAINHKESQRELARSLHTPGQFGLAWIKTSISTCKTRDPKGLYAWADQQIRECKKADVVGVDIAFEEPVAVDLIVDTETETPSDAAEKVLQYLLTVGAIKTGR